MGSRSSSFFFLLSPFLRAAGGRVDPPGVAEHFWSRDLRVVESVALFPTPPSTYLESEPARLWARWLAGACEDRGRGLWGSYVAGRNPQ